MRIYILVTNPGGRGLVCRDDKKGMSPGAHVRLGERRLTSAP